MSPSLAKPPSPVQVAKMASDSLKNEGEKFFNSALNQALPDVLPTLEPGLGSASGMSSIAKEASNNGMSAEQAKREADAKLLVLKKRLASMVEASSAEAQAAMVKQNEARNEVVNEALGSNVSNDQRQSDERPVSPLGRIRKALGGAKGHMSRVAGKTEKRGGGKG